jgi:hypothetical protein
MGFPLSVICSGSPIELDKPHILALAAKTGFLQFKEQVPLKFKKEISAVQCERKTFRLISLSTPVRLHWTVPLTRQVVYFNWFNKYPQLPEIISVIQFRVIIQYPCVIEKKTS